MFWARVRSVGLLGALVCSLIAPSVAVAQAPPPTVKVAVPVSKPVIDWDVYTGRFQAVESVVLQARVSGYLQVINFDDGQLVDEGELLYAIDPRPFEAAVAEAQARLDGAIALRSLAQLEANRAEELLRRNAGTRSVAQERRAQLQEAQANAALAEAQLDRARLDLEFTQIKAPFTGRISASAVDIGNLIIGGPAGATRLATLVSVNPIDFTFTVSEADHLKYSRLSASGDRLSSRDDGNVVFVQLMDEDNWDRQGRMIFVDNQLDPNSGTILGRASIANVDGFLLPGTFGRLRLPGSGEYEALLIPDQALVTDQSRLIAYVVNDDNIVEERAVITGPLHFGLRAVRSGISAEDRVIISGTQRARPGQEVTPVEEVISISEEGQ